jgi:galactonate dehydratase
VPVAPHNPGGPICMLAAMHLAAAIPNFFILEQMEEERALRDSLCTVPIRYADGYFELPTGPGLGTDLNLDLLAERSFRTQPPSRSSESLWH